MKDVWVIGFGKFGQRTVNILSQKGNCRMTIVDIDFEKAQHPKDEKHIYICSDGVSFLSENLFSGNEPDLIVPALPVHLAAEWLSEQLTSEKLRKIAVPKELESIVPNPIRLSSSEWCVSYADFVCPESCNEPLNICPVRNETRKGNMFETLGKIDIKSFEPIVIRSYQLAPGIGACKPGDFFDLLNKLEQSAGRFLVCTACRCHGMLTGFERS